MTERNKQHIYDDAAANWWSDDIRWVRTLKNLVPGRFRYFDRKVDWQGKAVLDLGCAGGFMAEALDERGARVTGLDPARDAIAAAREHAAQEGREIAYDVGVGEEMPYDDDSFDAVVCVDVLEHVSSVDRTLSEIARVLRPDGLFFFDTINRNWFARLMAITMAENVVGILPKGTHDPEMFITPAELEAALERAGMVECEITGLGPRGVNRRLDMVFGPLPVTFVQYMGLAKKPGRAA